MIKFHLPFKKKRSSQRDKPSPDTKKHISVIGLRRLNHPKKRRFTKRKIVTISIVILLILFIVAIFFLIKNNPLKLKIINFKNADLSCVSNEQIKSYLNLTNYNYFSLNPKNLEQKAKDKFSCISNIQISKKFPSTIEITANDRKLAALIRVFQLPELQLDLQEATSSTQEAKIVDNTNGAVAKGNFIVDQEGTILKAEDSSSDLPTIDYYNQGGELRLGSKIPNDLIGKSLSVINLLNQQQLIFKQIKIVEQGLFLNGDQQIILALDKDIDRQLVALQLIMHQATIDSKQVQKIDLRFDKAIVVYR